MNRPRRIAIGFDGSPDAEAALRWGLELAEWTGAEPVVVHAVGMIEHAVEPEVGSRLQHAMRRLAAQVGADPIRVRWHLVDGDPCSVLAGTASKPVSADLLVVGSRGQGAHSGSLLGSTSHALAERATIPLLIVPARA